MINVRIAKWILLLSIILLAGCASSKLKLELSIYKDDPLFKNVLTQDDIKPAKSYLDYIEAELVPLTNKQMELAQLSFDLFENYWMAQGEVQTKKMGKIYDAVAQQAQSSALDGLRDQLSNYGIYIIGSYDEVVARLNQANRVYEELNAMLPSGLEEIDFTDSSYIGQAQRQQRLQQTLSIEISRVFQSLDMLIKDNEQDFYQSTREHWGHIKDLIESDDYQTYLSTEQRDNLAQKLRDVAQKFEQFDDGLVSLDSNIKTAVTLAIDQGDSLLLINNMMQNPTTYELSAKDESNMLRAIDLLNSQIDRLQNASSPVWRIVTDPKNSEKWNSEFSKTYFYAEGNAGVVVVRDSPIKYRVQEATNNPAALVQAQLQVSRAVADAAIQIASATTGVPLVSVTQTGDNINKADNATYQQQTDTLVTKKAQIGAQKKIYLRSIDAIEGNIDSYLRQLNELNPKSAAGANDQAEINAITQRIIEFLKAQEKLVALVKAEQGGN